jgi:hypothetical protein
MMQEFVTVALLHYALSFDDKRILPRRAFTETLLVRKKLLIELWPSVGSFLSCCILLSRVGPLIRRMRQHIFSKATLVHNEFLLASLTWFCLAYCSIELLSC